MLALEDLKNCTEEEVVEHLVSNYSGQDNYDEPGPTQETVRESLSRLDILVAYESVGSWGCDSSSWFLFKDKESGQLYEVNAGHCSCYGFEGQFLLSETSAEVLKSVVANGGFYFTGGYDDNEDANKQSVYNFIKELP